MLHYRYLLIGGGMAADSAVRGIRDVDNVGTIGLLSTEADPPYDRPPLSKSIWLDHEASELDRGTASLDVSLHLGRRALSLDREERTVTDDAGQVYRFDRLLLATGGSPRRLPGRDDGVIYYRTLADYRRLNALCSKPTRVLVVGGGYIGAELGAALCLAGHEVHMAFPEATILERLLPPELGEHVNGLYRDNGVTLHPGRLVSNVQAEPGGGSLVRFENGSELQAGAVVAGLGILPETALAEAAGLRVSDGIEVNVYLQTDDPEIFAAGDVASIYSPALGRRRRVEHEENANLTGFRAGRAMAGELEEYIHLPMFYSDLFSESFEGVGIVDSRLDALIEWEEPLAKGAVHYLEDGLLVGALMWNRWGELDSIRELIGSAGGHRPG
mgnify:FL=1